MFSHGLHGVYPERLIELRANVGDGAPNRATSVFVAETNLFSLQPRPIQDFVGEVDDSTLLMIDCSAVLCHQVVHRPARP